jgi:kynurenine/2-aminoadipate aminotransferase
MNYARYINRISAARRPSIIREMTALLARCGPEMIPLSGGLPNPEMFPFKSASLTIKDGSKVEIAGADMGAALQYLPTAGLGDLVTRLKAWQRVVHRPHEATWNNSELLVTSGSQDGLCKALEMILNEGDSIVVEDYIYSGTLAIMNPYKPNYVVVSSDKDGMRPDKLREALAAKWKPGEMDSTKGAPKCIYINPTGANPTGTVLTAERRKEIYQIASEYNLLIIEDDPYYFMQFDGGQVPSFYSMDVEGRVLRFDSFSKIFSSGIRVGFATGPKPLINQIMLHMQVSVIAAASLSQVATNQLLKEWGTDGLMEHIGKIADFYQARRDVMITAADAHLTGLCHWSVPKGGMFLWIKVDGIEDTWDMIMKRAMERNIMLLPGKAFSPLPDEPCQYLRASFSIAPEDKIDVAFERLATLIREEQKMQK